MAGNKVVEFINLECAECYSVELIMTIVGNIALCPRCFKKLFGRKLSDPEIENPIEYARLNNKYKLKVGDYRYTEDGVVNKVGVAASQGQARAKTL